MLPFCLTSVIDVVLPYGSTNGESAADKGPLKRYESTYDHVGVVEGIRAQEGDHGVYDLVEAIYESEGVGYRRNVIEHHLHERVVSLECRLVEVVVRKNQHRSVADCVEHRWHVPIEGRDDNV